MSVVGQSLELAAVAPPVRKWRQSVRQSTAKCFPPALVFVLAASGTFSLILLREAARDLPPVTTLIHRALTASDLGLKVDSEGSRLVLRWDRQNPLMLSATGATLLIQDGSQSRTIHLDASQLADGSVAYKPLSGDVSFRLEVSSPEGATTASMRVLDGTSRPVPKLSASDARSLTVAGQ
jgi:hypothetical protein